MRKITILILSALFSVQLACGQSATPTPLTLTKTVESAPASGDSLVTLRVGDLQRSYLLHIPKNYNPARAIPLVLVFHGIGLNADEMVRITGFSAQADTSNFVVVYPNGSGESQSWNGGDCCGEARIKNVDDVEFVHLLLEDLATRLNIDPQRVYATGFSNGAIMSYRLACDLADRIAAIAPVSAAQAYSNCQPGRPVSIIHFHGTADRLNPYEGGSGTTGKQQFESVAQTIQFWVQQNDCPAQAQTEQNGSILHETYAPCQVNSAVELYTIQGGEHAWPGGEAVSQQVGVPTSEIAATPLIWDFFSQHSLP